jgi:hypothetical protein
MIIAPSSGGEQNPAYCLLRFFLLPVGLKTSVCGVALAIRHCGVRKVRLIPQDFARLASGYF